MSQTTTLKLPDELKDRIAIAASESGKTPHAFMVEALAAQTVVAERRRAFIAAALAAEAEVLTSGEAHDADDVFAWMREKLAGRSAPTPRPQRFDPKA